MTLWKLTLQVSETRSTTITSFVDPCKELQIKRDSIERIVKCVKSILSLPESASVRAGRGIFCDISLPSTELTLTALLARELDRFLFPDPSVGACLHQFPVHIGSSTPERADIYIVKYNSKNLPANPICATDFKTMDMAKAETESTAYSIRLMETQHGVDDSYIMCLNFPSTRFEMKLQLHMELKGRIMVIDICRVGVIGEYTQLAKFFCVLYAAVHDLIMDQMEYSKPCVSPTRSLSLSNQLTVRVFEKDGYVYKLFDTKSDAPNFELVSLLLPEAELIDLSRGKRFQMLKYKYLIGSEKMQKKSQYVSLLRKLHQIHDKGYIHSDIRDINIIVGNGDEAWIIDFDLAGFEGTEYPYNYNHLNIQERHKYARAGNPRKTFTTVML